MIQYCHHHLAVEKIIDSMPLEPKTIDYLLDSLCEKYPATYHAMMSYVRDWWYSAHGVTKDTAPEDVWSRLEYRIAHHIRPPRDKANKLRYKVSQEDINILITNVPEKVSLFIRFLVSYGVRITEMCNLKWENLKEEYKDAVEIQYVAEKTRLKVSRPIDKSLLRDIKRAFDGKVYIFETTGGKQFRRNYISGRIAYYGWKYLNEKISAHSLRHFWSVTTGQTMTPNEASRLMGHKNLGSRYNHYYQPKIKASGERMAQ